MFMVVVCKGVKILFAFASVTTSNVIFSYPGMISFIGSPQCYKQIEEQCRNKKKRGW